MKWIRTSKKNRLKAVSYLGICTIVIGTIAIFKVTAQSHNQNQEMMSTENKMTELLKEETPTVLVEVWSDYLCPWCYIGEANLENAIADLGINATVVYKSFQSNPTLQGAFTVTEIAKQSGFSLEEARKKSKYIEDMASSANVELHMDSVIMVNTMDAHRLAYMAKQKGHGKEMAKRLFEASYVETKNIADPNVLTALGEEFGISKEETFAMLKSDQYRAEIKSEIQEGINNGLRGVPYFVINKKYSLSGAQPKEVFKKTFTDILQKDGSYTPLISKSPSGYTCDENGCEIPNKQ
ncbi:DsbA family oxidoreductase [Neptunitalea lumnitzerae]|uniref:DSBA oxidoreductase n=1 Tax=Neptunitalea lumnitzerae TaxID=2965509 RepID=A0ABQ5MJC8_9FLAO|nr:DsbA family oxidoreductase [Neptunitalea sp. Y10]GLB49406.1 DSBA oxidoreductase [Neptunitalea sp. Y10]